MSAPRSNLEIIFADWLDAMRRGDSARMGALLTADAVHQGIRDEWICANRDEILARAGRTRAMLPSVEALELVAAGDKVVMSVRAPGAGVPLQGHGPRRGQACVVFTLRDGRITRMQDYLRRADALAAAGVDATWQ